MIQIWKPGIKIAPTTFLLIFFEMIQIWKPGIKIALTTLEQFSRVNDHVGITEPNLTW